MKRSRKLKLQRLRRLDDDHSIEATLKMGTEIPAKSADNGKVADAIPEKFKKGLANIATSAWKARCRMIDPATGGACDEMRRVCGDIERIERCLNDLGIIVEDHTNKPFDYGLPWQVVATKPTPGITREIVTETLKPTVWWNEQIIQHAEVEIGTPTGHEEEA